MLVCGVLVGSAMAQLDSPPLTQAQIDRYQAIERYMSPGREHERLAERAGTWVVRGRVWAEPDAAARTFDGISELTMIMGGRYLYETIEGDTMGAPFYAMSITGFDNAVRRFVQTRIDSLGTGIARFEGSYDDRAGVLAMEAIWEHEVKLQQKWFSSFKPIYGHVIGRQCGHRLSCVRVDLSRVRWPVITAGGQSQE